MYNDELKKIKDEYIHEIINYYHEKGLTKDSIMGLDTIIHTAKNLCKLIESGEKDGMSYSGGYSMLNRGGYSNMMDNGMSYARGRGQNANRDSMGRYSSTGYSGHQEVVAGLHDLMNRTTNEESRRELQQIINDMEMR